MHIVVSFTLQVDLQYLSRQNLHVGRRLCPAMFQGETPLDVAIKEGEYMCVEVLVRCPDVDLAGRHVPLFVTFLDTVADNVVNTGRSTNNIINLHTNSEIYKQHDNPTLKHKQVYKQHYNTTRKHQ